MVVRTTAINSQMVEHTCDCPSRMLWAESPLPALVASAIDNRARIIYDIIYASANCSF